MECIHCKAEIENDDNFCHNCGHWTTHGYLFFKQNPKNVEMFNGEVIKQNNKVGTLMTLLVLGFIIFTVMMLIRGGDMFRPYYYLKKQIYNWKYGYNTSLISATNQYEKEIITTIEDANDFIERDIGKQDMECSENLDILVIENELKRNYDIPSVSLCDVDTKQAENIQKVVDKIFTLFPSAKGYLTNITIANATTSDNYIAYFQPNYDNGFGLSGDLEVRHMKSSGKQNPIPFSMITNIFNLRQIKTQEEETQQEQQQIEQDPQILDIYKQTIANSTQSTFVAITILQDDPSKCKYTLSTMDKRTGERKIVQEVVVDFNGRFSMETIPSLYNQLCDGIPAIDYENERRISFQNMDNSKMMGFSNLTPEQKQLIQNMKQFVDNHNINMQPEQTSGMHR